MKFPARPCWFLLFLILLFSGHSFSQTPAEDKLLAQISKETNDTAKIKLMVLYVMVFGQRETSQKWYDEIHSLSVKNHYRPGLIYHRYYEMLKLFDQGKYDEAISGIKGCIDALDSLGVVQPFAYPLYHIQHVYFLAGKPLDMFRFYTDKIAYYRNHGPIENTAACYLGLGQYYRALADNDKAIGYFMRALEVYKSFDPIGVIDAKLNIGGSYMDWGNLDKAEEFQKSTLKDLIRSNEVANTDVYDALGDIYVQKHDYKEAMYYYFEGKRCYKLPLLKALNYINIASVHLHLGHNDSALFYLERAEKIRQQEKLGPRFSYNYIDIDFYFYKYYAATGNKKQAVSHLKAALESASLSKNIPLLLTYTKEFHSFLLKHGDSLQSLRYLLQYNTIQDSLDASKTQARIATFEVEQQAQQKGNEIEQLKFQKAAQRRNYLAGGFIIILILLAFFSRLRYKRKRDKEQLTSDFKNQLARAETKALRAQMNPHFIFNSLNSINSFVMDQQHELASEYLIKFSKLIRLILDNSRSETISIEKELEALKLYVLLESARFDNKFKCVYHIAAEVNTNSIMIPPMLLQPFVENAIWHGLMQKEGEGTIVIELAMKNEELLMITIEDDGIGREKAAELKSKSATHKSHGLKVTSQRIEMMNKLNSSGAQVTIEDLKDEQGRASGTRVELVIPI
jgi:tetratricopeptide (TPR) repeat protein